MCQVWWVPPTGIRSVLRLALRHLNIPVMSSMESHHQEVIGFLRQEGSLNPVLRSIEVAAVLLVNKKTIPFSWRIFFS
jgi:hypothetical protein